jgi:hypothetical protein
MGKGHLSIDLRHILLGGLGQVMRNVTPPVPLPEAQYLDPLSNPGKLWKNAGASGGPPKDWVS